MVGSFEEMPYDVGAGVIRNLRWSFGNFRYNLDTGLCTDSVYALVIGMCQ